ncbi:MAG: MlaD family protein [Planctomycetia bacterium]|nr:MlaD family protein [Planctomycetia bacterium]
MNSNAPSPDQSPPTAAGTLGSFPTAVVVPATGSRLATRLWWLVLLSLIVAAVLVASSMKSRGPVIVIQFTEGHGLKPGDVLRYRGIAVGEVSEVLLKPDLNGVVVKVQLELKAAHVARKGSQFWIERPRVSMARVSGLETVLGAKFVSVLPGPVDGPNIAEFVGSETAPTMSEPEFVEVMIRFHEGHGLQIGDPVRHRGIAVGEVTAVDLNHDLTAVSVRVRLSGESHHLAREGTQFWVERPRLSMVEVRGLDTLVGGRYVAVMPGPSEAPLRQEFDGLEIAPVAELPSGALEVVLYAPQRWGIDAGVPVTYRGLKVGQVLSVGLSSDGTSIEARAFIESRYRLLVRQNSVFWSTSGIDVNVGFKGFQLSADTLATIAQGGVAFATPVELGAAANTGQRFAFVKSPQEEWLTWQPRIASVEARMPNNGLRPALQRGVARWEEKSFGFRRQRERSGWLLLLANGHLLGPADVLIPSENALNAITLELAGEKITLDADQCKRLGSLATYRLEQVLPDDKKWSSWPTKRLRQAAEPEDCLIVADTQNESLPIAGSSLIAKESAWELRLPTGLSPAWHGAAVVASKDGQLVGLLLFENGKAQVALIRD